MTLAELQHDFRAWLVETPDETSGDTPDETSADPAPRPGAHLTAGLAVYRNNYHAQLAGCLEESFPQVRAWLGDEAFTHAVLTHIHSHPPHAWTLDAYAGDFGETLGALFPHNPDLHELAWIENALAESFVAADAEALPLDTLSSIDWDSARLRLAPSLMSRVATTNAEAIWSALQEQHEPPESEMLADPGGFIVWRRGFVCYLKQVEALEFDALSQVQENGSFAALCDWLVERLGETEGIEQAGTLLAGWLSSELIVGVE